MFTGISADDAYNGYLGKADNPDNPDNPDDPNNLCLDTRVRVILYQL